MAVETRTVEYKHRDTLLEGVVAVDSASSQPRPVVLVSHAWGGRDEFAIQKARDLARLGYVGFALDLYGQGKLGTSKEENSALMAPLLEDRLLLQARMESAIKAAASQPESDAKKVHGYDDPMAQPDAMVALASELTKAEADWQIHAYGGATHAFTNPAAADPDFGTVYSESADKRSWRAMTDFLNECFT